MIYCKFLIVISTFAFEIFCLTLTLLRSCSRWLLGGDPEHWALRNSIYQIQIQVWPWALGPEKKTFMDLRRLENNAAVWLDNQNTIHICGFTSRYNYKYKPALWAETFLRTAINRVIVVPVALNLTCCNIFVKKKRLYRGKNGEKAFFKLGQKDVLVK